MGACFLRGCTGYSLPASRSNGAFVVMFERCVKPDYRLGPNRRYAEQKKFFIEGCNILNRSHSLPDIPQRLVIFPQCLLPNSGNIAEMARVREWVKMLHRENALSEDCVEKAFAICKDILRRSERGKEVLLDPIWNASQNASGENPSPAGQGNESADRDVSPSTERVEEIMAERSSDATVVAAGAAQLGREGSLDLEQNPALDEIQALSAEVQAENHPSSWATEEEKKCARRLKSLLKNVTNEETYTMVHLALQDGREWEFGLFADFCLEEWRKKGKTPCNLVKQVLAYVKGKRLRLERNEDLEKRLKTAAELMDEARSILSTEEKPLPLFTTMNWQFQG